MKPIDRRTFLKTVPAFAAVGRARRAGRAASPSLAGAPKPGEAGPSDRTTPISMRRRRANGGQTTESKVPPVIDLNVPRDQVVAFALTRTTRGVLKLTAQLYPAEARRAARGAAGSCSATAHGRRPRVRRCVYPGWDAHFRIENWDDTQRRAVPRAARREGDVRGPHPPRSARQGRDRRRQHVVQLQPHHRACGRRSSKPQAQDPDLLFFAGDQTYRHTEHTAGWIEFGLQFRDVIRDRPDHHASRTTTTSATATSGARTASARTHTGDADGGYFYPVEYVNHGAAAADRGTCPTRSIPRRSSAASRVYFTRLRVGGIDFAILEDRKFKTGPRGQDPADGAAARPHQRPERTIRRPIDLPGLQLLGERQQKFLRDWTQDWTGAEMKCVLSQTAFCGAVHMHGKRDNRLLADLDCNGWPQTRPQRGAARSSAARGPCICAATSTWPSS